MNLPSTPKLSSGQRILHMHRGILTLALVPNFGTPAALAADNPHWVTVEGFHSSPKTTAPTPTEMCPCVLQMSGSHISAYIRIT